MLVSRSVHANGSTFYIPLVYVLEGKTNDYVTFKELLNSPGFMETIKSNDEGSLGLALVSNTQIGDEGQEIPLWKSKDEELLLPVCASTGSVLDYSSLFLLLFDVYDNKDELDATIEQIKPYFDKGDELGLPSLTEELFEYFLKGLDEYMKYTDGGDRYAISVTESCFLGDKGVVRNKLDVYNLNYQPKYLRGDNATIEQVYPEDLLNIRIPSLEELHLNNLNASLPNSWCDVLNYEQKAGLSRTNFTEVQDSLNKTIAYLGSNDNSTLPLFDNEKEFYEKLTELIDDGIRFDKGGDISDEKLKALIACGSCDSSVKDFLLELACLCYTCTRPGGPVLDLYGKYSGEALINLKKDDDNIDIVSDNDDKDDDDLDTDTVCALHVTRVNEEGKREKLSLDANEILKNFIEDCATSNTHLLAEAIIKLARWGERKCSLLCLGDTDDACLDLESFTTRTICKDFSKLELERTESGAEMVMAEFAYLSETFKDLKWLSNLGLFNFKLNLPVAVAGYKQYKTGEGQHILMSIIDMIEDIIKGNNLIEGITIQNNKIIVDEESLPEESGVYSLEEELNALNQVAKSTGDACYFLSDEAKKMYNEFNVSTENSSVLQGILRLTSTDNTTYFVEKCDFKDSSDFYSLAVNGGFLRNELIEIKLATRQLNIILKVAEKLEALRDSGAETSFETILNLYLQEIVGIPSNSSEGESKTNSSSDKAQRMSVFEDKPVNSAKVSKDIETGSTQSAHINATSSSVGTTNIKNDFVVGVQHGSYGLLMHDCGIGARVPVGYFMMEKTNGVTHVHLATLEEKDSITIVDKKASLDQIVTLSGYDLAMLVTGHKDKCKLRFSSDQCFKTFLVDIKLVMKKAEAQKAQVLEIVESAISRGMSQKEGLLYAENAMKKTYI